MISKVEVVKILRTAFSLDLGEACAVARHLGYDIPYGGRMTCAVCGSNMVEHFHPDPLTGLPSVSYGDCEKGHTLIEHLMALGAAMDDEDLLVA